MRHEQSDADLEARSATGLRTHGAVIIDLRGKNYPWNWRRIEARAIAAQKQMQHLPLRDHGGKAQCHGRGACGLIPRRDGCRMKSRRWYCMQPAIHGGSVEEAALHRIIGAEILGRRMKWLVQWGDKTWNVGEMNKRIRTLQTPKDGCAQSVAVRLTSRNPGFPLTRPEPKVKRNPHSTYDTACIFDSRPAFALGNHDCKTD